MAELTEKFVSITLVASVSKMSTGHIWNEFHVTTSSRGTALRSGCMLNPVLMVTNGTRISTRGLLNPSLPKHDILLQHMLVLLVCDMQCLFRVLSFFFNIDR